MTALLLTAFFAFCAAFAVAAIEGTWNSQAKAILALRQQLRDCADTRDVRYSVKTLEVRAFGAKVLRPDFKASRRPAREETMRAA